MEKRIVTQPQNLLPFLKENFSELTHSKLKNYFEHGCFWVNGKPVTFHAYPLKTNDQVELKTSFYQKKNDLFPILYEDSDLIAVVKPANILSIASEKEKEKTMYHIVREYIKQKNQKAKLFILHRLDRETAGILLFAKNEKIKREMQMRWDELVLERGYQAVVEGVLTVDGTVKSYINEDDSYYVKSSQDPKKGRLAITHYHVLSSVNNTTTLSLTLETGRKNQIRVHMKELGHPIVGDYKYGAKTGTKKQLQLQANRLIFLHPLTKEKINLIIKPKRN